MRFRTADTARPEVPERSEDKCGLLPVIVSLVLHNHVFLNCVASLGLLGKSCAISQDLLQKAVRVFARWHVFICFVCGTLTIIDNVGYLRFEEGVLWRTAMELALSK